MMEPCPECHNESMIQRGGRPYCGHCGRVTTKDPSESAIALATQSPMPAEALGPVLSKDDVAVGLARLVSLISELESLADDYDFVIPTRVFQIFEVAKDVILSRQAK